MSRVLASAAILLLACAWAQASNLKGIVVVNELGGQPIENVVVGAAGANPTATDSLGKFTLEFPGKRSGEAIRLIVKKEGFEVVNDVQLELALPADADAKQITIVVCKIGDREVMAARFYRLKSLEAIEAHYKKQVNELQKTQRATDEEIAKLQRERDQARALAESAVEGLATEKPGNTSELYQTAMRLFLDGRTEEALQVLDAEKLQALLGSAKDRKAGAEKEIGEVTQAWLLKARLFTTRFQFDQAEKAYQSAIQASPDSFDANFELASFSLTLNRISGTLEYAQRSLQLAQQSGEQPDIAKAWSLLGIIHAGRDDVDDARQDFSEALRIRRELAKKNPELYSADVASSLDALANQDDWQKHYDDALQEYNEALSIQRPLARKNPAAYGPLMATILSGLGVFCHHQNRLIDADLYEEEALVIFEELARKEPEDNLGMVAGELHNLAALHLTQGYGEESRTDSEMALRIDRELAQNSREAYLPSVASDVYNLGVQDLTENRLDNARPEFEEALTYDRELAQREPDVFQPILADTLLDLGIVYFKENRMDRARAEYGEALQIYERFAEKDPVRYQHRVEQAQRDLQLLP